jgi:hypothetical protein
MWWCCPPKGTLMLIKITAGKDHTYYVNSDHIECVNNERGEWSYSINHSRVPVTPECAKRLLKCMTYIEAREK